MFVATPLVHGAIHPAALLVLCAFVSFVTLFAIYLRPAFCIIVVFTFIVNFASTKNIIRVNLALVTRHFPCTGNGTAKVCCDTNDVTAFAVPLVATRLSREDVTSVV